MKLLILSDSHGMMQCMCDAVEKEHPDYIIHLGDHDRDAEELSCYYPQLPITWVRGNCDLLSDAPVQHTAVYGGKKIFFCHGHTLGVKSGLLRAVYTAREAGANVLLYGHTHIPFSDASDGLTILNPGACGTQNYYGKASYGVIEITPQGLSANYKFL